MKKAILLIAVCLFACTTVQEQTKQRIIAFELGLRDRLSKVDITDGINKEEAITISDNYYHRFRFSGCGAPGGIEETETTWNRKVLIGPAAQEIPERIIIDKESGKTTWKFGPEITDLKEIWTTEPLSSGDNQSRGI